MHSVCNGMLQEISAVKEEAEKDLAAAKPALDAAVAALNSITPKDIVGLKALKSPPDIIKRIFDTVLLLRYVWGMHVCLGMKRKLALGRRSCSDIHVP